jgi:hypothetical protein
MRARHDHCPECGCDLAPRKRRSVPDHRRLFALIKQAFDNWPEAHEFTPENPEHLRAWLVCKAGWKDATAYDLGERADADVVALALEAAIKAAKGTGFVRVVGRSVAVITPKSMDFRAMGQQEFGLLRDAITDIITAETGIEAERAAA